MAAELRPVLTPWSEAGEAWHAATQAFEQALAEQERLAREGLPTSRDEVLRLRYARRLILQVRALVPLSAAPPRKPWAQRHARCVDCLRTDREHKSGGRCTVCWEEWRRRARVAAVSGVGGG